MLYAIYYILYTKYYILYTIYYILYTIYHILHNYNKQLTRNVPFCQPIWAGVCEISPPKKHGGCVARSGQ